MNYSYGFILFHAVWSYKQLLVIDTIDLPIFRRIASVGPGNCIIIPVPAKSLLASFNVHTLSHQYRYM